MEQYTFKRVENNVGKGENAGYQHLLLFLPFFFFFLGGGESPQGRQNFAIV